VITGWYRDTFLWQGIKRLRVTLRTDLHLAQKLRMRGALNPLPSYAFTVWRLDTGGNSTLCSGRTKVQAGHMILRNLTLSLDTHKPCHEGNAKLARGRSEIKRKQEVK
jgi:hypothetical protein